MVDQPRFLVIYNPAAGWRRIYRLRRAIRVLEAWGASVVVHATVKAGDAEQWAREADGDLLAVVAAGGDGTVNEVVNGLMARPVPLTLGILPLGTANVVARELGLPLHPARAVAALVGGRTIEIRPGLANGRHFIQMAGIGFDAHVVARVPRLAKRLMGKGAYAFECLRELVRYRPIRYAATIDGQRFEVASAVLAKGRFYGGGFVLAPGAALWAPGFEVCLFERSGRRHGLRYLAATARSGLDRLPDFQVVPGREIRIDGPAGEPVQADGEIVTRLPLVARPADRTLPVLVPEAAPSAAGDGHAVDADGRRVDTVPELEVARRSQA